MKGRTQWHKVEYYIGNSASGEEGVRKLVDWIVWRRREYDASQVGLGFDKKIAKVLECSPGWVIDLEELLCRFYTDQKAGYELYMSDILFAMDVTVIEEVTHSLGLTHSDGGSSADWVTTLLSVC